MAKLSPVFNEQTVDINGSPLSGAKVFTYVAGSSTKVATYTNAAGTIPQTNPIILDALGYPTNGSIWIAEGTLVKFVLAPSTDTDPPTSPIRTIDNVQGVNDSSTAVSQWTASGTSPTYVNATTFTLAGDQTSAFEPGRRVQFTTSGGTVYGTILTSVFAALTTVTMQMDGVQVLDSGLSVANLGVLTTTNPSYPYFLDSVFRVVDETDKTKKVALELSGITTATTRTYAAPNKSGTLAVVDQIQRISASVAANALTISVLDTLILDFRSATLTSGNVTTVSGTPANLVISSGSTLGTTSAIQSDIVILAINNSGVIELAAVNILGGNDLTETGLISTTAEGGAGGADSANGIYSTTARSNVAYRVLGIIRSTQATAGTWATAPSLIQGAGGQAINAMSSIGYGQIWQPVTRNFATTYYNTTGKPIFLKVSMLNNLSATQLTATLSVNGVLADQSGVFTTAAGGNNYASLSAIIPPYASYIMNFTGGLSSYISTELR